MPETAAKVNVAGSPLPVPKRPLLTGAPSLAREEAALRGWMETQPAFSRTTPGGPSRALVALNRIMEDTRSRRRLPALEHLKTFEAGDQVISLLLQAEQLERTGSVAGVSFSRDAYGNITGVALNVEAR